jgi:hypothetical protein
MGLFGDLLRPDNLSVEADAWYEHEADHIPTRIPAEVLYQQCGPADVVLRVG